MTDAGTQDPRRVFIGRDRTGKIVSARLYDDTRDTINAVIQDLREGLRCEIVPVEFARRSFLTTAVYRREGENG